MAHQERPRVTVGVDTHLDLHVAHAKDQLGRCLETVSIPTTPAGYQHLLAWARGLGEVEAFGSDLARRRRSCRLGRLTSTTTWP